MQKFRCVDFEGISRYIFYQQKEKLFVYLSRLEKKW